MAVVGICMCKDEADIIGQTVRLMLDEVDHVIVADNGSTDGTRDILRDLELLDDRLTVRDDPERGYFQSRKMSFLARVAAHRHAASWVVPFDADERWYSPHGRIADVLEGQEHAAIVAADLYDHVATATDPDGHPLARIGWRRRDKAPLPKVACRPQPRVTIHQGNHDASYGDRVDGLLVIRHFPYRSPEQFESKVRNGAAAYAATDLPEHEGQHWRDYGRILTEQGPEALHDVFRTWFWTAAPDRDRSLIYDPCPA